MKKILTLGFILAITANIFGQINFYNDFYVKSELFKSLEKKIKKIEQGQGSNTITKRYDEELKRAKHKKRYKNFHVLLNAKGKYILNEGLFVADEFLNALEENKLHIDTNSFEYAYSLYLLNAQTEGLRSDKDMLDRSLEIIRILERGGHEKTRLYAFTSMQYGRKAYQKVVAKEVRKKIDNGIASVFYNNYENLYDVAYLTLGALYFNSDPTKALKYLNQVSDSAKYYVGLEKGYFLVRAYLEKREFEQYNFHYQILDSINSIYPDLKTYPKAVLLTCNAIYNTYSGNILGAIDSFKDVLNAYASINNTDGMFETQLIIANYYLYMNNPDSATVYINYTDSLKEKLKPIMYQQDFTLQMVKGNLHYTNNEYYKAIESYRKTLWISTQNDPLSTGMPSCSMLEPSEQVIMMLGNYSNMLLIEYKKDSIRENLYKGLSAHQTIDTLLGKLYLDLDRLDYFAKMTKSLGLLNHNVLNVLGELYKVTSKSEYLDTALYFSQRAKSSFLLAQMIKSSNNSNVKEDKMNEGTDLKSYVQSQKITEQLTNNVNVEVDRLIESCQATLNKANTLDSNTIIIDYVVESDKKGLIINLVSKSDKKMFVLELEESYSNICKKFNKQIKTDIHISDDLNDLVFESFIEPIIKDIEPYSKLIIIPNGALFNIPFELIKYKEKFLIEKFSISYLYGMSTWQVKHKKSNNSILALAPGFIKTENSLDIFAEVYRDFEDVFSRDAKLKPLPSTLNEVDEIYELFNKNNAQAKILKLQSASSDSLSFAKNYSILHMATHGIMVKHDPQLSGVFLADSNENNHTLFTFKDIMDSDLKCDLVVLSACKTGTGKIVEGEGVMALPRGFIYAGVPNVIASLWKVHDEKTKDLMIAFYKHLLEDKVSYAEALRLAKLDCIEKGFLPVDWAGFVLIGN